MANADDDDEKYEYHETTSEMDQGDAVPPKGAGWEWIEKLKFGSIMVHRWRRLRSQDTRRGRHP